MAINECLKLDMEVQELTGGFLTDLPMASRLPETNGARTNPFLMTCETIG